MAYDDKIANVHRARIWIRANNRGRRNINNFTKVRWALEDKEDLAAEAREKQLSGLKQFQDTDNQNTTVDPNSGQGSSNDMLGRTDRKIAESAGVGHNTVHQVTKILESGNIPLIHECETGNKSVNAAFMKLQQGKQRERHSHQQITSNRAQRESLGRDGDRDCELRKRKFFF